MTGSKPPLPPKGATGLLAVALFAALLLGCGQQPSRPPAPESPPPPAPTATPQPSADAASDSPDSPAPAGPAVTEEQPPRREPPGI